LIRIYLIPIVIVINYLLKYELILVAILNKFKFTESIQIATDVADGVRYKLDVTIHRCLHNKAPQYLVDCCVPVSDIASRQRLRSARRCLLTAPRHRRSTLGRRAFSVAGPAVWNFLPDQLRDSDYTESAFR